MPILSTHTQRVYETVKEKISTFQLKPGTRLVEEQIAEEIGVSRTPVREALEGMAARVAASRISEGEIEELKRLCRECANTSKSETNYGQSTAGRLKRIQMAILFSKVM